MQPHNQRAKQAPLHPGRPGACLPGPTGGHEAARPVLQAPREQLQRAWVHQAVIVQAEHPLACSIRRLHSTALSAHAHGRACRRINNACGGKRARRCCCAWHSEHALAASLQLACPHCRLCWPAVPCCTWPPAGKRLVQRPGRERTWMPVSRFWIFWLQQVAWGAIQHCSWAGGRCASAAACSASKAGSPWSSLTAMYCTGLPAHHCR